MPRVGYDIYFEQDDATSRLMLHVEGDVPVCLASYSRALVNQADSVTFVQIHGPVMDGNFISLCMNVQKAT